MRKQFNFYSDPGHGWLKVSRKDLQQLGIESQITGYSYQRENDCFLEEDCDATLFLNTFKNKFGFEPKLNFYSGDKRSRIRNYASYKSNI